MKATINAVRNNVKKTEMAYLAGIFDGEGSICIIKKIRPGRYKPPEFSLTVSLAMANAYIPKLFHFAFGGSFNTVKRSRTAKQPQWQWQCVCRVARSFLIDIKPFLRLKLSEAQLAIEFQNAKHAGGGQRGLRGHPIKAESEVVLEQAQAILMHSLKRKSYFNNANSWRE